MSLKLFFPVSFCDLFIIIQYAAFCISLTMFYVLLYIYIYKVIKIFLCKKYKEIGHCFSLGIPNQISGRQVIIC